MVYYHNRKAVKRSFPTKADAETFRKDLFQNWRTGINPDDVAEAYRLVAATGYTIVQMIQLGFALLRNSGATSIDPNATINDGIKAYKERQMRNQSIRSISITKANGHLVCIAKTFGARIVTTLTEQEVSEFLRNLKNRNGEIGQASVFTKLKYYQLIKGILMALGIKNPLPGLSKPCPKPCERIIQYYMPAQVLDILRAARPNERGAIAMAVFGGFRPHLLKRLSSDALNPKLKTIDIPDWLAKDKKGHSLNTECFVDNRYVPGIPEILWKWLEAYPYKPLLGWDHMVGRIRKKLGYWIQDGLRHTAATYYCKLHGRDAVMRLLTHGTPHLADKHYVGECSINDSELYYKLKPTDIA